MLHLNTLFYEDIVLANIFLRDLSYHIDGQLYFDSSYMQLEAEIGKSHFSVKRSWKEKRYHWINRLSILSGAWYGIRDGLTALNYSLDICHRNSPENPMDGLFGDLAILVGDDEKGSVRDVNFRLSCLHTDRTNVVGGYCHWLSDTVLCSRLHTFSPVRWVGFAMRCTDSCRGRKVCNTRDSPGNFDSDCCVDLICDFTSKFPGIWPCYAPGDCDWLCHIPASIISWSGGSNGSGWVLDYPLLVHFIFKIGDFLLDYILCAFALCHTTELPACARVGSVTPGFSFIVRVTTEVPSQVAPGVVLRGSVMFVGTLGAPGLTSFPALCRCFLSPVTRTFTLKAVFAVWHTTVLPAFARVGSVTPGFSFFIRVTTFIPYQVAPGVPLGSSVMFVGTLGAPGLTSPPAHCRCFCSPVIHTDTHKALFSTPSCCEQQRSSNE